MADVTIRNIQKRVNKNRSAALGSDARLAFRIGSAFWARRIVIVMEVINAIHSPHERNTTNVSRKIRNSSRANAEKGICVMSEYKNEDMSSIVLGALRLLVARMSI